MYTSKRLAVDIETQPDPIAGQDMPLPEVATGNLRDPIKIQEKIDGARAAQAAQAALDPHFGRIISIGFARRHITGPEHAPIETQVFVRDDSAHAGPQAAEQALLRQAWDTLAVCAGGFATFNGSGFDLPFMVRRSLLLGVAVPKSVFSLSHFDCRHTSSEHLDVMACLHYWECGNGQSNPLRLSRSLTFYASRLLAMLPPLPVDHATLGAVFDSGDFKTLIDVNAWDATATLRLAELCEVYYP
ncbi:MAG TPA: hypothetical protein VLM89_13040 [Phycisphaerae bacterium]|nr:hypothetical protein [Phycisphaerae bacterium]